MVIVRYAVGITLLVCLTNRSEVCIVQEIEVCLVLSCTCRIWQVRLTSCNFLIWQLEFEEDFEDIDAAKLADPTAAWCAPASSLLHTMLQ